jgi:toxin-antitoxin system PIN domain toxin
MSIPLADVNVLVALVNPDHIHHDSAHDWLRGLGKEAWATCPISVNGCLRILSQYSFGGALRTPAQVAASLETVLAHPRHAFWPDSVSILEGGLFARESILSGKQVTDIYLLGLAVRRGGHLVTFDRSIPWKAVVGAKASDLKILGSQRKR